MVIISFHWRARLRPDLGNLHGDALVLVRVGRRRVGGRSVVLGVLAAVRAGRGGRCVATSAGATAGTC